MKVFQQLQQQSIRWWHKITEYLDRLSDRERVLVIFMSSLLLITLTGILLWSMHQAAQQQQIRLNELNNLIVRMQEHVVKLPPATDISLGLTEKIQRAAQMQALPVSLQENNGEAQILASHQHYTVLAHFLTQLVQSGLSIEKMALISENGQLKLTATVRG